ncbi:hypothetical protein SISNIDRAFT_162053 [Sistotremastrum niveocremeum HHB9708]|uniref:NB-ARC domain-containing protein n=1 Tax=Sistotremastrum niveocremeum HHB9708 TaxID=1314777 RepID=A0A164SM13_9AGAM|nr:hypothetical protein SISNIDRAFT_162053 [Sistotremastrum niveocremeum HHB9708]
MILHLLNARARDQAAESLSNRVAETTWAICTALEDVRDAVSEELVRNVGQLLRALESISTHLKKRAGRGPVSKFLRASSDDAELRNFEEDFERSIDVFSLTAKVANIRLSSRLTRNVCQREDALAQAISHAYEEQQTLIGDNVGEQSTIVRNAFDCFSLPPPPHIFFGRLSFVESAVEQLTDSEQSSIAILGMGGIGKTTVAIAILHHPDIVQRFGGNRFFVSCDKITNREMLLSKIQKTLELTAPTRTIAELSEAFSSVRGPKLLVLDNFESPWEPNATRVEIESFLARLVSMTHVSVIVTMRGAERPLGVKWHRPFLPPLQSLDSDAARRTFVAISDVPWDDEDLSTLLDVLDNVPLAVALMANLAQQYSCAELLRIWKAEKTSMLNRGFYSRLSSLDVSIQVSLNSERLSAHPNASLILKILSCLPDGVSASELNKMARDRKGIFAAITALRQVAIIYEETLTTRLRLLSPIREYLQEHLPINAEEFSPLLNCHLDLTTAAPAAEASKDLDKANRILSRIANISTVLEHALKSEQPSEPAIQAVVNLGSFTFASSIAVQLIPLAISAAQRIGNRTLEADCLVARCHRVSSVFPKHPSEDKKEVLYALSIYEGLESSVQVELKVARALGMLADCHRRLAEWDPAVDCLQRSIAVYARTRSFKRQLDALSYLVGILQESGRLNEAQRVMIDALSMARRHEFPPSTTASHGSLETAACYAHLGRVYTERFLYVLAPSYFKKALEIQLAVLGENSGPYGLQLLLLGDVLQNMGRLTEAKECLDKAYRILTRLGSIDFTVNVVRSLGQIALDRGDVQEALTKFHVSLRCYEDLNWRNWKAIALIPIGEAEYRRGNYSTAWTHHAEARRLARLDNRTNLIWEARAMLGLGRDGIALGRYADATTFFVLSGVIHRKACSRGGIMESLVGLGDILLEYGDLVTSKALFQAALDMIRYIGIRRYVAECLMKLGDVAALEEKVSLARDYYERSLAWYNRAEHFWGQESSRERLDSLVCKLV